MNQTKEGKFSRRDFLKLATLTSLGLSGCAKRVGDIAAAMPIETTKPPTNTPEPSKTNTPTSTNTETPTPTKTATNTPEPSPTFVDEFDMEPHYTDRHEGEYNGVMIKGAVVVDKSLSAIIDKVDIHGGIHPQFIAETMFRLWWSKSGYYSTPTKQDLADYFKLWAQAQKSGDPADWKKVQIKDVWSNDLTDGNGYVPKPITIWPMCEQKAPNDVLGFKSFDIILVKESDPRIKNVSHFEDNEFQTVMGTNHDKETLYFYLSTPFEYKKSFLQNYIAKTKWWLNFNRGVGYSGYPPADHYFIKLLTKYNSVRIYYP